ncbi:MAG: hypothetical protein JRG83_20275 [Deltaproteobacteria bacterium]|nr:hypothetical protein [Deltaproteobacteria bacterium]
MEAVGRNRRIGAALGLAAGLFFGALAAWLWVSTTQLPAVAAPRPSLGAEEPVVDLARLYALDHLVLEGDPILEFASLPAVGAGPARPPSVPEPGAATLWILGFAALYTLYLPAGSW